MSLTIIFAYRSQDEQLFRTEEVTSTGQPLGIVVAETLEAAEKAARLVKASDFRLFLSSLR